MYCRNLLISNFQIFVYDHIEVILQLLTHQIKSYYFVVTKDIIIYLLYNTRNIMNSVIFILALLYNLYLSLKLHQQLAWFY